MKTRNRASKPNQMITPPNTLGHCIFCLRQIITDLSFRKVVASSSSGNEKLTMVPHAVISSSTDLLATFNLIWPHMRTTACKDTRKMLAEMINGTEQLVSHTVLPPICQLCADQVLQVEGLMKALWSKVNTLRRIITDSKREGLHSWRMDNFEKNLKDAGWAEEQVKINLQYWDHLGDHLKTRSISENTANVEVEGLLTDTHPRKRPRTQNYKSTEGKESHDELLFAEELKQLTQPQPPPVLKPVLVTGADEENHANRMEASTKVKNEPLDLDATVEQFTMEDSMGVGDISDEDNIASQADGDDDYPLSNSESLKESEKLTPAKPKTLPTDLRTILAYNCVDIEKQSNSCWEFVCPEEDCGKGFPNKRRLTKHTREEHPEKSDCYCPCGQVFPIPRNLQKHQKRCDPTKRSGRVGVQKCDMCKERIYFTDILEHVQNHVGDYALKCPNEPCPYMFTNTEPIVNHMNNVCNFYPKKRVKRKSLKSSDDGTRSERKPNREYLYTCEECGFESYNRQPFRTHIQVNHERTSNLKHQCPISGCDAIFSVRQSVDFHLSSHKLWKSCLQKCELCSKNFQTDQMGEHLANIHQHQELYPCPHCSFTFPTRSYYVEHLYKHRNLTPFFCDICGTDVKFSKHKDLRRHYITDHQQVKLTQLICELCGSDFPNRANLRVHVKKLHGGTSNANDDEAHGSNQINLIRDHKLEVDGRVIVTPTTPKPKKYSCDLCNDTSLSFPTIDMFCSHKIQHHGMDPFRCSSCDKHFTTRAGLSIHEKTYHEGIRKECPCPNAGCGKVFDTERKLKRHLYKAHKEKNLVCAECGKAFATRQSLKIHHNSTHLGVRSHVCEICGDAFTSSTVLKRHKLIHTGERPFECDQCGQRFRHKEVLTRHIQGHAKKGDSFKPNGPMKQIRKRQKQN